MIRNKSGVAILMCSYNGEEYIDEQISSIRTQSNENWTLYIHDDGSNDKTLEIINKYQRIDERVVFVDDQIKHLGAGKGFMHLLETIDSELYMFCDQDDVWKREKIDVSLKAYYSIPNSANIPVVVHSDVSVVDQDLNILAESYWSDINLNPDKINSYSYFCVCCYTNGNTMLFNNKAKQLCFPIHGTKIMHDRYVSGHVLKAGGVVKAIHQSLVLYRQHSNNVCGFQVGEKNSIKKRITKINQIYNNNLKKYQILKEDNFGSVFKYIWYKLLVECHMRLKRNY